MPTIEVGMIPTWREQLSAVVGWMVCHRREGVHYLIKLTGRGAPKAKLKIDIGRSDDKKTSRRRKK